MENNLQTLIIDNEHYNEIKDKYHTLDNDITEIRSELRFIRHEVKNISTKLEVLNQFDNRLTKLETVEQKKRWTIEIIFNVLNFVKTYWSVIFITILLIFAFDIKLEVENPHILEYIKSKIL